MINKGELVEKIIKIISDEIESLLMEIENENKTSQDSPSAMQSWSDTTRSQKEYLINALNTQVSKKEATLSALKSIDLTTHSRIQTGSLIRLDDGISINNYFIVPGGSGISLIVKNIKVRVISPSSLVAHKLIGNSRGDILEIKTLKTCSKLKVIDLQ